MSEAPRKVWLVESLVDAVNIMSEMFVVLAGAERDVLFYAALMQKGDPGSRVSIFPGEVVLNEGDEPIFPAPPAQPDAMIGVSIDQCDPDAPYFGKYHGDNGWDGGFWEPTKTPEEIAADHKRHLNRSTMVIKMTGPGYRLEDLRRNPDFVRLQAAAADAQSRLDAVYKELAEKFPPPPGLYWSLNAAGTLGRYSTGSED